tara:strand:+ start:145 stop:564 length:420 start_codon:yes stop_codon:yes gene_type:complete
MKHSIKLEYKNNYLMIGIVSTAKPHKICSMINKSLNISFKRSNQVKEFSSMFEGAFPFTAFRYKDQLLKYKLLLVENCNSLGYFLKDCKELDYLIFIKSTDQEERANNYIKALKDIDIIQLACIVDFKKLKSAKTLIIE